MSVPTPFQIITVAEELHKFYRAACKALVTEPERNYYRGSSYQKNSHDHGWQNCHRKAYFMRRAVKVLQAVPSRKLVLLTELDIHGSLQTNGSRSTIS